MKLFKYFNIYEYIKYYILNLYIKIHLLYLKVMNSVFQYLQILFKYIISVKSFTLNFAYAFKQFVIVMLFLINE